MKRAVVLLSLVAALLVPKPAFAAARLPTELDAPIHMAPPQLTPHLVPRSYKPQTELTELAPPKPVVSNPSHGGNGYFTVQCVWGVAVWMEQDGTPVPSDLGNANTWDDVAASYGFTVSAVPRPGAVAQSD